MSLQAPLGCYLFQTSLVFLDLDSSEEYGYGVLWSSPLLGFA